MFPIFVQEKVSPHPSLSHIFGTSDYVVLDIETTGLSRKYHQIVLVGLITEVQGVMTNTQIFAEELEEEALLLFEVLKRIQGKALYVTFNGQAFDLPFIKERLKVHGLPDPIKLYQSFDLLRAVRQQKKVLPLPNYRLKTIELHLGIHREDRISGKESIDLYQAYLSNPTKALRNKILLHNYDDIENMVPMISKLQKEISFAKEMPRLLILKNQYYFIKDHHISKGLMRLSLYPHDKPLDLMLPYEDKLVVDLPLLTFSQDRDYYFLDTDLALSEAFDSLTPADKKEYLLAIDEHCNDQAIKKTLEKLIQKTTY